MDTNNVFDQNMRLYEEWFTKNSNIFDSEIEVLKQVLPTSGKGIEIGVGTGIFSSRLGIKDGVEPSQEMRSKAIERGVKVIDSFAEELPIPDETYDFALMVTVDCFLSDPLKAFKEAWRIISKDGLFIVAFIDKNTPLGKVYEQNKSDNIFYKNAKFHSANQIETLLRNSGFVIVDKKQTVFNLVNKKQEILSGVGKGVFAVIKGKKTISRE